MSSVEQMIGFSKTLLKQEGIEILTAYWLIGQPARCRVCLEVEAVLVAVSESVAILPRRIDQWALQSS